jgi:thiamine-phosphate pyrophosphorylase
MAAGCQLYLSIPAAFSGEASLVEKALAAARAPSLLVLGEGTPERLAAMIGAAHRQNATVLTDNAAAMANVQGFDGLHLPADVPAIKAARDRLGPDRIVGADCLPSRHEAMTLAEAGADYIAFGRGEDGKAIEDLAEMIGWWGELIELPCAAWLAADAPEAAWRMLAAGADFVIPGPEIWDEPQAVCGKIERLAGLCG